ncbi:three-Cys-motif partner protein TcmP [Pedobacter polysacchareus]|uniref:three-Cys-motif partner protein TcmP n=1 Tax=Pedobacter polysacchareus TaxID=2861973 RepID=UPI001C9920BB|nr:three-Cys-motif partner protein TcmP [Pedobacter polysacchareus]
MEDKFFETQTISSEVKAKIVSEYFPQYCKILLKRPQKSVRYLDLFAGPGKYGDNKHSTPLLIAKACAEDPMLCKKVQLIFNDKNYSKQLEQNFKEFFDEEAFTIPPRFGNRTVGEDSKISEFLNKEPERRNPNPTLLFFDPFGYKGIDTLTLAKFISHWGNELFLFVNIKRINQAIAVGKFDEMMQALFPTTISALRKDRQYAAPLVQDRLNLIMNNLANEFIKAVGVNLYHCAFRFQEEDSNGTSHFIVHFTKNQKGYELIKKVYHAYDNIGATLINANNYAFDAKKRNQAESFDFGNQNIEVLSSLIENDYKGQQITSKALFDEHQQNTIFSWSHYLETLRHMANKDKVKVNFTDGVNHKKSVLISDNCILNFN